jgi:uncharacterized membrane protein
MQPSSLHFFPLALPFVLILFVLISFWIISVEIGILQFAYEKMGVNRRYVFGLLLLSLVGSYVNVPVAELPGEHLVQGQVVSFFGMRHVIPMVVNEGRTIVAVNLGGAIIPTLLSLYLLVKNRLWARGIAAIIIVAVVVHSMAQPVRGLGIAMPMFVSPLVAAAVAVLLSRKSAPSLAYICGSLGTLIGADISNLDKIAGLGAPVASIGGAGTFDGIFLTGILAVLLA